MWGGMVCVRVCMCRVRVRSCVIHTQAEIKLRFVYSSELYRTLSQQERSRCVCWRDVVVSQSHIAHCAVLGSVAARPRGQMRSDVRTRCRAAVLQCSLNTKISSTLICNVHLTDNTHRI